MSRGNRSQRAFKGSWRAAGPLSVALVLGATLGLSQVAGASPSASGGHADRRRAGLLARSSAIARGVDGRHQAQDVVAAQLGYRPNKELS
jgi:hypothetical protein